MSIVEVLQGYHDRFKRTHGVRTTVDQWSALNAMLGCRTRQYGEIVLDCSHCCMAAAAATKVASRRLFYGDIYVARRAKGFGQG